MEEHRDPDWAIQALPQPPHHISSCGLCSPLPQRVAPWGAACPRSKHSDPWAHRGSTWASQWLFVVRWPRQRMGSLSGAESLLSCPAKGYGCCALGEGVSGSLPAAGFSASPGHAAACPKASRPLGGCWANCEWSKRVPWALLPKLLGRGWGLASALCKFPSRAPFTLNLGGMGPFERVPSRICQVAEQRVGVWGGHKSQSFQQSSCLLMSSAAPPPAPDALCRETGKPCSVIAGPCAEPAMPSSANAP